MKRLRTALAAIVDVVTFPLGLRTFRRTRHTPHGTYRVMRKSLTVAPRWAPRVLSAVLRTPEPTPAAGESVLPLDGDRIDDLVETLRYDGFVALGVLSPGVCDRLERLARTVPARLLPTPDAEPVARFDDAHPRAPKYDIPEPALLGDATAQALLVDPTFRSLAGRYLGCEPVNTLAAMWWSAPTPDDPSSEVAQLFHADRDHPSFLKVFCYLTDVGPADGPHVYVRGSHRERPVALRTDRRFGDDEVLAHVDPADVTEICGPRGLVFAADTSGLHKGLKPQRGARLVFQIEFASSLFGAPYVTFPTDALDPSVRPEVEHHPHTYERLLSHSPSGNAD